MDRPSSDADCPAAMTSSTNGIEIIPRSSMTLSMASGAGMPRRKIWTTSPGLSK
jgi:hypothetical protein